MYYLSHHILLWLKAPSATLMYHYISSHVPDLEGSGAVVLGVYLVFACPAMIAASEVTESYLGRNLIPTEFVLFMCHWMLTVALGTTIKHFKHHCRDESVSLLPNWLVHLLLGFQFMGILEAWRLNSALLEPKVPSFWNRYGIGRLTVSPDLDGLSLGALITVMIGHIVGEYLVLRHVVLNITRWIFPEDSDIFSTLEALTLRVMSAHGKMLGNGFPLDEMVCPLSMVLLVYLVSPLADLAETITITLLHQLDFLTELDRLDQEWAEDPDQGVTVRDHQRLKPFDEENSQVLNPLYRWACGVITISLTGIVRHLLG